MRSIELEMDYGTNVSLNDVEYEIYFEIKGLIVEADAIGDKDWTPKIKSRIGSLGRQQGYEVLSTLHNREWLFDLVWCTKNENHLESVKLVLESELCHRSNNNDGKNGLIWDFEKLLVSNADIKVMICCNEGNQDYPANINRVVALFEESFRKFSSKNDARLLLIIIDDYHSGDVIPHVLIHTQLS